MIRHHMILNKPPMTWEEFVETTPPRSIAIDGSVTGPYRFNQETLHLNLNHHEGCPRLVTRATCAQVLMLARMGLYSRFVDEMGSFDIDVWMNDCDNDVSTALFILDNPAICRSVINPKLNKLVGMEDHLDTTAGCYPYPYDIPGMEELNWIFDPYWRFRLSGGLDRRIPGEYMEIISDVHLRINGFLFGDSHRKPLDTRFVIDGGGKNWKLIRELGSQARAGIFSSGIEAFISWRSRPDHKYVYTFCRSSDMVNFPLEKIYGWCNELEECTGTNTFGGGDIVGGSPRMSGSKTSPQEMEKFINSKLDSQN